MGVFGTGPGHPLSSVNPSGRDRPQERKQPKKPPSAKAGPHRDEDQVELDLSALPQSNADRNRPSEAPAPTKHIDLQG
jgi:hypothetical protein